MTMNANLRHLILWRDVRISGAAFASGLLILIALSFYSVLVVATCIAIPFVVITLVVRGIYAAKCALLKQHMEHPFQHWLDEGWEIKRDKVDSINRRMADNVNTIVLEMKRIALVEDIVDSIRGLLFLLTWYYIGKNISGLALLFLGFIGLFTIPKIYDIYRKEIDNGLKQLRLKYDNFYYRIVDNIPGLSKKSHTIKSNGVNGAMRKEEKISEKATAHKEEKCE